MCAAIENATIGSNYTKEIQSVDAEHHWHPFTDTKELNEKGVRVITGGEGVYITDSTGEKIIDGMAGLWCTNLGYGRKELIDAAKAQLDELAYYNNFFQTTTAPAALLAKEVASVTPGDLNHIFFAGSGSEAVDTILRMVRHYWVLAGKPEKNIIIGRENAYHGSTIGGTSIGGMGAMHGQGGPYLPNIERICQPFWYGEAGDLSEDEFGLKAAKELEDKILEVGADNVAAFIGEPIQGAGGVIVPPKTYWPEVKRICDKYDILLASDEVICGYGRTGSWFGCETFGFQPDIMSMAKGLSSGYLPISAVAVGDRMSKLFIEEGGEFFHGFTYSGHPVAAATALENIKILKRENIISYVGDDIGPYFQEQLREKIGSHPMVGHIEGVGLIAGIQLMKDKASKTFLENGGEIGTRCRDHCFENGLIMRGCGDRMVLSPPLVINKGEVDEIIEKALKCIDLTWQEIQ